MMRLTESVTRFFESRWEPVHEPGAVRIVVLCVCGGLSILIWILFGSKPYYPPRPLIDLEVLTPLQQRDCTNFVSTLLMLIGAMAFLRRRRS